MDVSASNAVAGPSNTRRSSRPSSPTTSFATSSAQSVPLFLPPAGPPLNPVFFTSTEDLLGKFLLSDAYDKYVRPVMPFVAEASSSQPDIKPSIASAPTPGGSIDKGKGKEVVPGTPHAPPLTPAADGPDDDDDGAGGKKGEKKKKNSYRHLIKSIPGKHSMKKDDFLTTIMQVPPKERVKMVPFDMRTQTEAFTVSAGGIPGYNVKTIVKESPQAREDRKKNREAKQRFKAEALQGMSTNPSTPQHHPQLQTPIPTSATSSSFPPPSTPGANSRQPTTPHPLQSTPGSRPASVKPHLPPVHVPGPGTRVGTPLRTGTPTGPHPLSAPPLSASALMSDGIPASASGGMAEKRGIKRERDDDTMLAANGINNVPHGNNVNGTWNGNITPNPAVGVNSTNTAQNPVPKAIVNAKAGTAGARPRPIKKPRLDVQGQGTPVQQPTPQGV